MTTHHTPPEPGAVRSIVAPHMGVLGSYRDMLSQDVALAASILRTHEADLEDALLTWRHCHGEGRATWRRVARLCVERVRLWRGRHGEAFTRLCGWRVTGREAA